ncbi:DUF6191 domain-containing protein [Streptomyces sp. SGAir0957]
MFEELFAPGRKHTNDERKRLELTRVDLNDGDPGRGPIDLSSGKVTVRPAAAPSTPPREPAGQSTDEAVARDEADARDEAVARDEADAGD